MSEQTKDASNTEQPWHAAYPAPKTEVSSVSRHEVLQWLKEGKVGKQVILVDVRRNDFEGGTIRGSLNLPAQSLYPTLPAVYSVLSQTPTQSVIWYCGSSNGRGPRAAGWFADYVASQHNASIQSLILEGGIKGWVSAGPECVEHMDEYDSSKWPAKSG